MKATRHLLPLCAIAIALLFAACKKDDPLPHNPYDDIVRPVPPTPPPALDPNTIQGIHQNILMVKCNNPGCHDGTFEPDFRTVHSAWSTLAYHRIVKNDSAESYQYRVVPYDTSESMMIRRLTRGDEALQQMPATGDYLTSAEMGNIVAWINNGARDMFGNLPVLPNNEPTIVGFLAMDSAFRQLDTNRVDDIFYYPFWVKGNSTVNLYFLLEDDSTAVNDLTVNQVKLSTDMDDFSTAITRNAFYLSLGGYSVWTVSFNTNLWTNGTTVYFRYYVNDGDHAVNSEFPRDDLNDGYKSFFAFKIQ
jgi:hypothetical protein